MITTIITTTMVRNWRNEAVVARCIFAPTWPAQGLLRINTAFLLTWLLLCEAFLSLQPQLKWVSVYLEEVEEAHRMHLEHPVEEESVVMIHSCQDNLISVRTLSFKHFSFDNSILILLLQVDLRSVPFRTILDR